MLFQFNISEVKASDSVISESQSKIVTQNFIDNTNYVTEWRESDLILKHHLYDVDDSILGYYFEVFRNNGYLGYIITSGTTDREPILQFGEGILFEKSPSEGDKFYFLNAFSHIYAENKLDLQKKFNETKNQRIKDLENDANIDMNFNDAMKEMKETELKSLSLRKMNPKKRSAL
ncbi:hypothetical protein [Sporosarcina sp. FSL K6-3457]|uniref:hypothetical protein n=1 Tax=Sporosarcina sp. FSL K6-3457 TaxID=2978204 RepID=UPI0030F757FB